MGVERKKGRLRLFQRVGGESAGGEGEKRGKKRKGK